MKPKHLNAKDPWLLAENIPDCDLFFFQIPASCFTNDTSYPFIKKYEKFLATYKRFEQHFYFGEKNSFEVAESILAALIERPKFGDDVNKNIVRWSRKMLAFAQKVDAMPLSDYSNRKLWEIWKEHDDIHTKLYTYGWLPVSVDMFHNNMTSYLKKYLRTVCDGPEEVESAFVVLTTPTRKTVVAKDREEFLRIYGRFKGELKNAVTLADVSKPFAHALKTHAQEWGHLGYIFAGNHPAFGAEHYVREMVDLAKSGVNGKKLLKKDDEYLRTARRTKNALYKKLKVDATHRRLFEAASEFALTKLVRRHSQLFTLHRLHRSLLAEIAKRLKLTRFQAQFMLMDEAREALLKNKVNRRVLRERLKQCAYYTEQGIEVVYTGARAKKLATGAQRSISRDISEIKGQTAQPGMARGIVKIIIRAKDMVKMNEGDILVSVATDPDIVPAMKKAAAIVTEQGGITSHAAIVSRELGVPCIIGTKIATQVFKDGDRVEVNANHGWVRKL